MDDKPSGLRRDGPDLAAAVRAARAEAAVRSDSIASTRTLALARLQVLQDALAPVLAQVPATVDLFDTGIMPGEPPRFFIDMIAFVEMTRDHRTYRLYQDRRHGRVMLGEADTLDGALDAVTAYIARRLVERDRALASDEAVPLRPSPRRPVLPDQTPGRGPLAPWLPHWKARPWAFLGQVFWFVVEVCGLLTLGALILVGCYGLFARA